MPVIMKYRADRDSVMKVYTLFFRSIFTFVIVVVLAVVVRLIELCSLGVKFTERVGDSAGSEV
jgi:hypothetical protein